MKSGIMWKNGLFIAIAVTIILAFIYGYLELLGFLASTSLNSADMLQSVIQAEATILGFLGVVAAYMLSSYDSRLDRVDQQYFEIQQVRGKEDATDLERLNSLKRKIATIKTKKNDALFTIAGSSIFLIISLFLSITTLAVKNQVVGAFGFYIFFGGISNLVFLFYQVSKDTNDL